MNSLELIGLSLGMIHTTDTPLSFFSQRARNSAWFRFSQEFPILQIWAFVAKAGEVKPITLSCLWWSEIGFPELQLMGVPV